MAMANAIDVISLSATTPEFASQRRRTSTTVAPAASSIPRTPTIASGRVSVLRLFSRRDSKPIAGTSTPADVDTVRSDADGLCGLAARLYLCVDVAECLDRLIGSRTLLDPVGNNWI